MAGVKPRGRKPESLGDRWDSTCLLVKQGNRSTDDYGNTTNEYIAREVFCKISDSYRDEFSELGSEEVRETARILIKREEYDGEVIVAIGNRKLWVSRTHEGNSFNTVELSLFEKRGDDEWQ